VIPRESALVRAGAGATATRGRRHDHRGPVTQAVLDSAGGEGEPIRVQGKVAADRPWHGKAVFAMAGVRVVDVVGAPPGDRRPGISTSPPVSPAKSTRRALPRTPAAVLWAPERRTDRPPRVRVQAARKAGRLVAAQRLTAGPLTGVEVAWCVVAGWALDLFRGEVTRQHEDLEIAVPAGRFPLLRAALAGFAFDVVGSGRRWPLDSAAFEVLHQTWVREPDTGVYRLDIFREPHDADTWICRRDQRIRLPYEQIIVTSPDGVPYLVPEIVTPPPLSPSPSETARGRHPAGTRSPGYSSRPRACLVPTRAPAQLGLRRRAADGQQPPPGGTQSHAARP
jgi:hypothetical protein